MPASQLLSSDPKAGVLLSADPSAGVVATEKPAVGVHSEATIRAPREDEPVTLGELVDNPVEAIGRIGTIIKRDLSDPRTWIQAAGMYFGPKALNAVLPTLSTATMSAMKSGTTAAMRPVRAAVESGVGADVVGIYSPRLGNAMRAGQRIVGAMKSPAAEQITEAVGPVNEAAAVTPPAQPPPAAPPTPSPAAPSAAPETPPTAPPSAPATPIPQGVAMKQGIDAFKAAGKMPQPGEVSWVTHWIQQGMAPAEAVAKSLAMRPAPVDPAAALAAKLGTPSDTDVQSVVTAKNARATRAKGGTKD